MSFSAARPIVLAPAVPAADDARGENNFTKRVARFDTSTVLALITVNAAGGVADGFGCAPVPLALGGLTCNLAGEPGSMTVSSSGGVPRSACGGGIRIGGAWRGGTADCRGGALGGLAGWRGGAGRDGAPCGPPWAGPLFWPPVRPCGGRGGWIVFVCSASADQVRVGGPESWLGRTRGGWPVWPCCGPTAKVRRGPCGFPMWMLWPSWISTTGIR